VPISKEEHTVTRGMPEEHLVLGNEFYRVIVRSLSCDKLNGSQLVSVALLCTKLNILLQSNKIQSD
jgi:hypothetical protein